MPSRGGVGRGAWGVGRGAWGVGRGAWGVGRDVLEPQASSPKPKKTRPRGRVFFFQPAAYSPGEFLNSWMASLLLTLSARTTALA